MLVASGVAFAVGKGVGVMVDAGLGVAVAKGVAVGEGIAVGRGVEVAVGVAVGDAVGVGGGVDVGRGVAVAGGSEPPIAYRLSSLLPIKMTPFANVGEEVIRPFVGNCHCTAPVEAVIA